MIYWNSFVFTTFAAKTNPRQPMTRLLIAIVLGGGTGSVLRYCVQMMLHERIVPYSFPWATFTVNILWSFLIGLFYTLSARFNLSTEVRLLRRIHHLLPFQQWRTDSDKARILRNVCLIYLIKYHIRSPGSLRRRRLRTLYITQTPLWNPASLLSCLPYASSLLP